MIFGVLTGYERTAAFKGALDLDLFTAVAEGNDSAAELHDLAPSFHRVVIATK
jgi:hypothetical protein